MNWIIWYACSQHLTWGLCLMSGLPVERITGIATLSDWFPNHFVEGLVLVIVGVIPLCPERWLSLGGVPNWVWKLLLCVPQQLALVASAIGALEASFTGSYPDGYETDRAFIFNDVGTAYTFAALFHACALVELHILKPLKLLR